MVPSFQMADIIANNRKSENGPKLRLMERAQTLTLPPSTENQNFENPFFACHLGYVKILIAHISWHYVFKWLRLLRTTDFCLNGQPPFKNKNFENPFFAWHSAYKMRHFVQISWCQVFKWLTLSRTTENPKMGQNYVWWNVHKLWPSRLRPKIKILKIRFLHVTRNT